MFGKGKQKVSAGDNATIAVAGRDLNIYTNSSTELIDKKISENLIRLKQARFYTEFDKKNFSIRFGNELNDGILSGGGSSIRGPALSWCSRILSRAGEVDLAEIFLNKAKSLGDYPESVIAQAFIDSQNGNKAMALQSLASEGSKARRSAALMIVCHHDGDEKSLNWVEEAGYTVGDLDADGKTFLLGRQLHIGYWEKALETIAALTEEDFDQAPILYHFSALGTLVSVVPLEFREILLIHLPLELQAFPLSSDKKQCV